MFLIYNTLIILAITICLPIIIFKVASDKNLKLGLKQRLTIYKRDFLNSVKKNRVIWIHASSVGEVNISIQLVKDLKKTLQGNYIYLITTMTATGFTHAKNSKQFGNVAFVPFDVSFLIKRFLKIFSPELILIAETEFWPNIFYNAHKQKIPLIVFNCRVSDKSVNTYLKFGFFFKKVLNNASLFLCQNSITKKRLEQLGVGHNKIILSKNIKFDIKLPDYTAESVYNELKIPGKNVKIITAGSTHANEEEIILSIFDNLKKTHPNLLLIIAPRHPERAYDIAEIAKNKGISYKLLSENFNKNFQLLIIDKIGLLTKAYSISSICFIGGSLILKGGHNPLEAVYYKKPVISGKNIFNFSEIYNLLEQKEGVILINNQSELENEIIKLLTNNRYREKTATNGVKVLRENRGAIKITAESIKSFIK